jgi:hypothetical protein
VARRGSGAAEAAAAAANEAAKSFQSSEAASEAGRVLRAQRDKSDEAPVEPKVEAPKPESRSGPNPQSRKEDELVELHRERVREQEAELAKKAEEPKAEVVETPETVAAAPDTLPVTELPPSVSPVAAAPTVKVKVFGEEFDVPQAEVDEAGGLAVYQKQRAADVQFKKANEVMEQARREREQLMQFYAQHFQTQPRPQQNAQQIALRKAELLDQMLYSGTTQERLAAYEEMNKLNAQPTVDADQIRQRTLLEFDIKVAANQFKTEFADVLANPDLMQLARFKEQQMMNGLRDVPSDWNVHYRKIGNELRALVSRPTQPAAGGAVTTTEQTSQQQAAPTSAPTSAKEARKSSNVVSLPQAAARAPAPAEQKPKTREDILNEERRARGIKY